MVRVRLIGMMLAAVFLASAMVSASASALQWLLNGRPIHNPVLVLSRWSWLLADRTAPGGGLYVICEGTDLDWIGPLAKDTRIHFPATVCRFQPGRNGECEASDEVTTEAVNLPYLSLLLTVRGQTRNDFFPHTGGANPGWSVTCTVLGIFRVADECTSGKTSTSISNLASGVDETSEESEPYSCTEGTSTSGFVIGTDLMENPTGQTISVSNSPNT
jgi:hypothetical protein